MQSYLRYFVELKYVQGTLDNATASMVKLLCTEKLNEHSSNLLQLFGGWGYMWEYVIFIASYP